MQTKQNAQMHLKWKILKGQLTNVEEKRLLYLFLWGGTGDNSDRTMNIRSKLCQRTTAFILNEPLS